MDFSWKTVFEYPLSESRDDGKTVSKVAKLVNGSKVTKRKDIDHSYHINRLEIRTIISGTTAASIAVSLAHNDFQWLINCIEKNLNHSVHAGRKFLLYADLCDTSASICNVDSDRIFGVVLSTQDKMELVNKKNLFDFALKNLNLEGAELKNLSENIFLSIVAEKVEPLIKERCNRNIASNAEHSNCCSDITKIPGIQKEISSILSKTDVDVLFNNKFEWLMDLLNVKPPERLTQIQIVIPNLRSNIEEIVKKINSYYNDNSFDKSFDEIYKLCLDSSDFRN